MRREQLTMNPSSTWQESKDRFKPSEFLVTYPLLKWVWEIEAKWESSTCPQNTESVSSVEQLNILLYKMHHMERQPKQPFKTHIRNTLNISYMTA